MNQIVVALLMTIGCICSADLPREAQREMDSFTIGLAKADADRQAKVNTLVDKAVKALNEVSKKASSVETRRAIDDQILELQKLRKADDLLGDGKSDAAAQFVGRWTYTLPGWSGWIEAKRDGTASISSGESGSWQIQGNVIRVTWASGRWNDFTLPIDPDGTAIRNTEGKTGTAVKETKK